MGISTLPRPLTARRCPAGPGDAAGGVPPRRPRNLPIAPQPARRWAGAVSVSCSQFLSLPDLPRSNSIFVTNYLMAREHSAEFHLLPINTCVLFPTFLRRGLPLTQVGSAMHRALFIQGPIQRLRHFHSARPRLPKPTPYQFRFLAINHRSFPLRGTPSAFAGSTPAHIKKKKEKRNPIRKTV